MKTESVDFEIRFFESVIKDCPNFVDALIPLAEAYTQKGMYQKGLEIDERLALLCKEDPIIHYNLACSLALVGRPKEAIKALKRAILLGYSDMKHLKKDRDLKSLHGDPEFDGLL